MANASAGRGQAQPLREGTRLATITADTITVDPNGTTGDHVEHEAILSEDLRTRIVKAVGDGMSKSKAARLFGVSLSSTKRYVKIANRGESLRPRKGGGRPPKTDELTKKLLEEDVQERPAATISERRSFLERACGKSLSDSTVRRLLKRMGFSQKNGLWGRWSKTSG